MGTIWAVVIGFRRFGFGSAEGMWVTDVYPLDAASWAHSTAADRNAMNDDESVTYVVTHWFHPDPPGPVREYGYSVTD